MRTPLGLGLSIDSQNVVTAIDDDSQARRSGVIRDECYTTMPRQSAQTANDGPIVELISCSPKPARSLRLSDAISQRGTPLDVVRRRLVESHLKPVEVECERLAFVTRAFFA